MSEVTPKCRHGWYDGERSHVCYQPKNHPPPCKCDYCGAVEGKPPEKLAGLDALRAESMLWQP